MQAPWTRAGTRCPGTTNGEQSPNRDRGLAHHLGKSKAASPQPSAAGTLNFLFSAFATSTRSCSIHASPNSEGLPVTVGVAVLEGVKPYACEEMVSRVEPVAVAMRSASGQLAKSAGPRQRCWLVRLRLLMAAAPPQSPGSEPDQIEAAEHLN